jgi:hypothetical protein
VKRPTPDQVIEIVSELGPNGEIVPIPEIVAKIRQQTGCSRATAYRGVADAMGTGAEKETPGGARAGPREEAEADHSTPVPASHGAQARSIAQGHRLAHGIVEAVAVHTLSSPSDM